jgi:integrase
MPREHDGLELTADGFFRTRLRYGKGLRARFVIKLCDEAAAAKRAERMRELADMLARAGHSSRAPIILEEAGAAPTEKDFDDAVKYAEALCAGKGKAKAKASTVTFADFAERWTDGTLTRDHPDHVGAKKTADHDASRFKVICGVTIAPGLKFGDLPISGVTLDHCEAVMGNLPDRAKRPATRRQYAQLLHRALELAVFPCRLIDASPLPRGFMPKIGKPPSFPYLYPSEDAALLAHKPIPLGRRMLWGFLNREGCRTGEALALRIGVDVDLDRGVVKLDRNKTDTPRAWAMDPGVADALRAYVKLRGAKTGDFLFVGDDSESLEGEKLAKLLRDDIRAAGIERAELLANGENTRQLRAHDLRGTFVTLSLANGKTETWVADRTGHASSIMINRYRRAARTAAELGLGPLAPLNAAVPDLPRDAQGGPTGGPERQKMTPRRGARRSRNEHDLGSSGPSRTRTGTLLRARDFKAELGQREEHEQPNSAAGAHVDEHEKHEGPPVAHEVGRANSDPPQPADSVEVGLVAIMGRASAAGEWAVVAELARQLDERRRSRAGVADLDAARFKRR